MLPKELLSALRDAEGFDEPAFVAVHESGATVTSVRSNPAKISGADFLSIHEHAVKIPWSSNGYYLPERPIFTLDPLLHAGTYYVQEASSMFLEEAMRQCCDLSQNLKVLDLCAAPGGKSTLLQSIISKESLLLSNEVIKTRVNILSENITKWGAQNVIVTNNDPQHFQRLQNYFDVIVVDAPCSGSGLFRKDPAAINEWSENNVVLCSHRQQRILADILPSLKEDGILIYSTCSYSVEEDESIMQWLADDQAMENLRLKIPADWGIIETASGNNFGYRFYPDKVKGEGFFIACFKKAAPAESHEHFHSAAKHKKQPREKQLSEKPTADELEAIRPFMKNMDQLSFIKINDAVISVPLFLKDELSFLQSALYIKKAGVRAGVVMKKELIPDHELALSDIIHENIPAIEVDQQTAVQYLRREAINLQTPLRGWALIKYQGSTLGWIKLLGNRSNNYYPKEWRILMKNT